MPRANLRATPSDRLRCWACFGLFLAAAILAAGAARGAGPTVGNTEAPPARERLEPIEGRIEDASGTPVAGADVDLFRDTHDSGARWSPCGSTLSDQDGKYSFGRLPAGRYSIAVEAAAFAPALVSNHVAGGTGTRIDAVLSPPVQATIELRDAAGRPVRGASLRSFRLSGANGVAYFTPAVLEMLGLVAAKSDESGRLLLPPLPEGNSIQDVGIEHPDLVPARLNELTIASGATATVTMQAGVSVGFRVMVDDPANRPRRAWLALRREMSGARFYENSGRAVEFDDTGAARVVIEPGEYGIVRLTHDDYYFVPSRETPVPTRGAFEKPVRIDNGRNDDLRFEVVLPSAVVRGRVVDERTGNPVPDVWVDGDAFTGAAEGAPFSRRAKTNAQGKFTLELTPGRVELRVHDSLGNRGLITKSGSIKCLAEAGGSTTADDLRVRWLPPLVGTLRNPDGSPAAGAVVRLDPRYADSLPVLTDEAGRFEIEPQSVFVDKNDEPIYKQKLWAMEPYRPLAVRVDVRLDEPAEMQLRLEAHEPGWLLTEIVAELGDWEKGAMPAGMAEQNAAISLRGKVPPELDGGEWLNTGGKQLKLADLRGDYVLLMFFISGCGACDNDLTSATFVRQLYQGRGLVVVGVNTDIYQMHEERMRYEIKTCLRFPVAIDDQAKSIATRYQQHGIRGWASRILIGPDGNVVLDDRTVPYPSLAEYQLEIVRDFLLRGRPGGDAGDRTESR